MAQAEHGNLDVVVVSPARPIFEGEARFVAAPAWDRVGRRRAGRSRA